MNSKVSIIKCNSYDPALVFESVKKAVDLLGGVVNFIKPGSRVLVKPNILMAKEPEFGVTTHPEVVRVIIKILKEINCKILVGDGPSVWGRYVENVDEVYSRCGISRVCKEENVELVKFDKRRMREKFPLTTRIDECEYLVNVPKFKTHGMTILTGAIKNLFGLVSGTYKTELHKNYFKADDFAKILVDVYQEAKPALTIIDGITAMEGDGPATSGKLRAQNLLLAGSDCVALDSVLALIMGLKPLDILTTKVAAARKLGEADIRQISIFGEALKDVIGEPFLLPVSSWKNKLAEPIFNLARFLIKYYPYVEHSKCIQCCACIKACPVKVISMEKQIPPRPPFSKGGMGGFNMKNNKLVFKYKKCIACFCCQEVCPNAAIKVKKSLLAKMIGL